MVLADLGRKINAALQAMSSATVIDEDVHYSDHCGASLTGHAGPEADAQRHHPGAVGQ